MIVLEYYEYIVEQYTDSWQVNSNCKHFHSYIHADDHAGKVY